MKIMREAESLSFLLQKQLEKDGEQDTIEAAKNKGGNKHDKG